MKTLELKKGTLCYYDTIFSGLVPCKCTSVFRDERGNVNASAIITDDWKAYKKGMEIKDLAYVVVPRRSVYTPKGKAIMRIKAYKFVLDGE